MGMFQDFIEKHPGKIVGILLGLLFGWFAITHGLLKALFVTACIIAGYHIGKRLDDQVDFKSIFAKFFGERQ